MLNDHARRSTLIAGRRRSRSGTRLEHIEDKKSPTLPEEMASRFFDAN
jgi:hypothetical protein